MVKTKIVLGSRIKQYRSWVALALVITAVGAGFWLMFYFHEKVRPVYKLTDIKITSSIEVSFSQPVKKSVHYELSPALPGAWRVSKNPFGLTALNFVPAHALVPGSSYMLKLANVSPVLASRPSIIRQAIKITVEKPAAVAAVLPKVGAVNVPTGTGVEIRLASPSRGLRQLRLESDVPLLSAEPTSTDDQKFDWKFGQPLQQGQTYSFSVLDLKQGERTRVLLKSTFTTVPEPHIREATNRDHFYPGDTVRIAFDQDMKPVEGEFDFKMPGSGQWQDRRTYVFTPSGLSPAKSYDYTVHKGAISSAGGVVEADHSFQISTPGAAYVTGIAPTGGNVAINSTISFSFDQPVDHNAAQAAFSLAPSLPGSFRWLGNTMVFSAAGLTYQTSYTATLAAGIKSVYGRDSAAAFSNRFTTTYQVIKLAVPYYRQAYALSCEEASLRMALAYRGINVSENDILARANYNPRPRDTTSNSWDNPYNMYVGDVSGQMGVTGWGVYSPVISAVAQSYGRTAAAITGISVGQIAQAVHDGNPVVLWGFNGPVVKPDSWNTSSGVVQAPRNEHVRVVYGVAGSATNPVGFYLHDPIYGDLYWNVAQLQSNMSFQGTLPSQGVVVY